MATLLNCDGTEEPVNPTDGERFSLSELQGFVGGHIELVGIVPDPRMMFVNEDGWRLGLPLNPAATGLYRGTPARHDGLILGPAVLMTRREAGEE